MAEQVDADTASWKEVEVTFYVTAVTSLVFLLIFEIARRRPVFRKVFDRRRSYFATTADLSNTQQQRTPPPLLASRLPEWLFLSTDPVYTEYADFLHTQTVIQERKRQQEELNRKRLALTLKGNSNKSNQEQQSDDNDAGFMARGGSNIELEEGEVELAIPSEDDDDENEDVENGNKKASTKKKKRKPKSSVNTALTPDVVVVNGRRLHVSVVKEVEVWNLTDDQLEEYEQQLIAMEMDSEQRFRERYNRILQEQELRKMKKKKKPKNEDDDNNDDDVHDVVEAAPRGLVVQDENGSEHDLDLSRVQPPPRWRYLGFTTLVRTDPSHDPNSKGSVRVAGTRGFLDPMSLLRVNSISDDEGEGGTATRALTTVSSKDSTIEEYEQKNQYLKTVSDKVTRPLSVADEELLRCVGLDAYVMLRFLRFGFDVTFYPFLVACAMLIPTYYTNDLGDEASADTSGYFRFTFNRLEQGSVLLWVPWSFSMLYFTYFLYRLYVEWEVFISLRSDFIANGDADMDAGFTDPQGSGEQQADADNAQQRLIQYRNTCLVEYVPVSHQSDQGLFEFFDAIFPSQVERAEILMKADSLTKLIAKRQKLVELYENIYAQYFHVHQKHRRKIDHLKSIEGTFRHYLGCRCCRWLPKQPPEPMLNLGGRLCCYRKMEKSLPHYLSEIQRLNTEINAEHARISEAKKQVDEGAGKKNILARAVGKGIQFITGNEQYTCSTGFVEFKNLSTKQNALQCNISGTTHFMTSVSAPDPRDLNWDNAGESHKRIHIRLRQCQVLLFAGALLWFFVVSFVTSISNLDRLSKYLPSYLIPDQDSNWYGIIQGYLPVVALELLMLLVPIALRLVATKYIRMKTNSDVDKFVFIWHFAYRLANLVIIILNNQILRAVEENSSWRSDIRGTVGKVAEGVAFSSQFFMNNMIAAAGTATMWELAQMPSMIVHFFTYVVVTVEAKSKRALEKLDQPSSFEWGDIFPPFIFALLIGTVYATIVPFLLGVCAVFFYLATKVYTHQALFVYVQPYEGGGKLMYLLNRTLFTIVYFSIAITALLFALKEGRFEAPTFFASMTLLTLFVDYRIQTKFVAPSISLNLTNARIIDNEERVRRRQAKKRRKGKKSEKDDAFIFRQPQMNKQLWETKPRPYR